MLIKSVWGKGEELTLNTIKKEEIKGKWLDLAAGDGRYINELLEKADSLVLADRDANELKKVQESLSKKQKSKTSTKIFDMTKRFPFENRIFEGVFCTGTLHLFTQDKLNFIFSEITRVLKPKGKLIIDFATDVRRVLPNGELVRDWRDYILRYRMSVARKMLNDLLSEYKLKMEESTFEDDLTNIPEYGFKTKGNFILVVARKN